MNSRTALKLALGAGALQLYCAPLALRGDEPLVASASSLEGDDSALFRDAQFLRMWLAFALTLSALCGVVSQPVVLAAIAHALVHFARSVSDAPPLLAPPLSNPLRAAVRYWEHGSAEACAYEYGALLSFALLLRCVLFPPASALRTFERHSRNLKRFFALHDKQFVPLVDRLLGEYTGHERLLYARIRRLYCPRAAAPRTKPSAHLKTP